MKTEIDICGEPLCRDNFGYTVWLNRDGSTAVISTDLASRLCLLNIDRLSHK